MAIDGNSVLLLVNIAPPGEPFDYEAVGEQRGLTESSSRDAIDASHKLRDHMVNLLGRADGTVSLEGLWVPDDIALQAIERAYREKQVVILRKQVQGIAVEQREGVITTFDKDYPDNDVSTITVEIALNDFAVTLKAPDDVLGLVGWYEAQSLVEDGAEDLDPIETWPDMSDAENDLVQAIGGNQPILRTGTLNQRAILRFTTNNFMTTDFGLGNEVLEATAFVVYQVTDYEQERQNILDGITEDDRMQIALNEPDVEGNVRLEMRASELNRLTYPKVAPFPQFVIQTAVFSGTTSEFRENRSLKRTGDVGDNQLTGLTVGANWDGSDDHLEGDIAEIILYDRRIREGDRASIEVYLSNKYALELGL